MILVEVNEVLDKKKWLCVFRFCVCSDFELESQIQIHQFNIFINSIILDR